jgi:hypothetical protein
MFLYLLYFLLFSFLISDKNLFIMLFGYIYPNQAIVLSVLLRYSVSDCPFGIFKLFFYIEFCYCWRMYYCNYLLRGEDPCKLL